jgi:hypothetical protein
VAFPHGFEEGEVRPPREWFVVDLFNHHAEAGVALDVLEQGLMAALLRHELSPEPLLTMARAYGTEDVHARLRAAVMRCRGSGEAARR